MLIIPHSKSSAKLYLIVIAAVYLLYWGITGAIFAKEKIQLLTWIKTGATVTDVQTMTGADDYTEYTFEAGGEQYVVRKKGIMFWGNIGDTKTVLYSPKDPSRFVFKVELTKTSIAKIMAECGLIFAVFPLFYGIEYWYWSRKESGK